MFQKLKQSSHIDVNYRIHTKNGNQILCYEQIGVSNVFRARKLRDLLPANTIK